jgi:hypothetical protein
MKLKVGTLDGPFNDLIGILAWEMKHRTRDDTKPEVHVRPNSGKTKKVYAESVLSLVVVVMENWKLPYLVSKI